MSKLEKLEKVFGRHSNKLFELLYREKINIECPSEEEKWIIFQYKIISIIHQSLMEVNRNAKRR